MIGETNSLLPAVVAAAPKAAPLEIVHRAGPPVRVVVQPDGSVGAPSKFSVNVGAVVCRTPSVNGKLKVPRSRSPSWRWKVRLIVSPQLPELEKWKLRIVGTPLVSTAP